MAQNLSWLSGNLAKPTVNGMSPTNWAAAGAAGVPGAGGADVPAPVATAPAVAPPVAAATAPAAIPGLGGGWEGSGNFEQGLQKAFAQGLTGDAAIHWMNGNGYAGAENPAGGGIQYYANSGQYGLPDGYYAAPNSGGTLDLIKRSPEGASSAAATPASVSPTTALPAPGASQFTMPLPDGSGTSQPTAAPASAAPAAAAAQSPLQQVAAQLAAQKAAARPQ